MKRSGAAARKGVDSAIHTFTNPPLGSDTRRRLGKPGAVDVKQFTVPIWHMRGQAWSIVTGNDP